MKTLQLKRGDQALSRYELSVKLEGVLSTLLLSFAAAVADGRDAVKAVKRTAKILRSDVGYPPMRLTLKKLITAAPAETVARVEQMQRDFAKASAELRETGGSQ